MILPIPAIDILEGKVVRLNKGDYEKVEVFSTSPFSRSSKVGRRRRSSFACCRFRGSKIGASS